MQNKVVWICGHSCTGKTYLGDYLSHTEQKWLHVNGDMGANSKDSSVSEAWQKLAVAFFLEAQKKQDDQQ